MSPNAVTLQQALRPLQTRWRWRNSLQVFWITLVGGLIFSVLLLAAGRIWPLLLQRQLLSICLLVLLILTIAGQLFVWLRPLSLAQLVRLGDRHLGLDERLTTALELSDGTLETSPTLYEAQLNDTLLHLEHSPISEKLPLTKRRPLLAILSFITMLAVGTLALILLPNPQEPVLQAEAELESLLETEISELREIQTELLTSEAPALENPQVQELSATLDELINELETAQSEGSPEQAVAALSEAEQALTALNEAQAEQTQVLNALAEALAGSDSQIANEVAEALAGGDADQAAETLQQAADNPPTNSEEAQALSEALDEAAADLADANPALAEDLAQASDALESGDPQAAQEALNQAAESLSQLAQEGASAEQVDEALDNVQQARQEVAQQQSESGTAESQAQQGSESGSGESGDTESASAEGAAGDGQNAGQSQGESQGDSGSSQGEQAGQSATQGESAGSGSGRGEPGDSSTSETGAVSSGSLQTNNGPNQNRLEDYNSVYAPTNLGGEGGPTVTLEDAESDNSGTPIGETAPNTERPIGEATVPYTEVYQEYRNQAANALDNSRVPLRMRDYIRQYFGDLEPTQ